MQRFSSYLLLLLIFTIPAAAQEYRISKSLPAGASIQITNLTGRVSVAAENAAPAQTAEIADPAPSPAPESSSTGSITLIASSDKGVAESEVRFVAGMKTTVEIEPGYAGKQINLTVMVPLRSRVTVETGAGSVDISGNLETINVTTSTGTVSADVPDDAITYDFTWTEAHPRYLADFELANMKEGTAGKFFIRGRYPGDPKDEKSDSKDKKDKKNSKKEETKTPPSAAALTGPGDPPEADTEKKSKKKKAKDIKDDTGRRDVALRVTTARGIVLLNVDEREVGSDLRERPLTMAAKAIVRSGDTFLMDAIRRASPKYFGAYTRTLPPAIREPYISERTNAGLVYGGEMKTMLVNVTDNYNRSVADLEAKDFEVTENGESRDVVSVRPVTAPFNLVLLLDVSGSVDNYVNFIRKAARQFITTMGPQDRIAIITFNDDVHEIALFTADKALLSKTLDSFDAGGGTAYYDALAYTLADVLRPHRGDRTAIVVLTDGDDNRSFLSFDTLKSTIQESGALIYPLYVPSSLIAASETAGPDKSIDWMRQKYMGLTAKAEGEGEKLAHASGGVYYPITQISQIQTAYDDIAKQLRTAYSVTYRSAIAENKAPQRLRVKVKRENAFVKFANQ